MVLGYHRLIWARFVAHQSPPTVPPCLSGKDDGKLGRPFYYICANVYLAEEAGGASSARLIEPPNVTRVPLTAK